MAYNHFAGWTQNRTLYRTAIEQNYCSNKLRYNRAGITLSDADAISLYVCQHHPSYTAADVLIHLEELFFATTQAQNRNRN